MWWFFIDTVVHFAIVCFFFFILLCVDSSPWTHKTHLLLMDLLFHLS